MKEGAIPAEAEYDLHLFRKSLPLQVHLEEILRSLGSTREQRCLEVGTNNALFSYRLSARGGEWETVVTDPARATAVSAVCGRDVPVLQEPELPFEEKSFDAVVLLGVLERTVSDEDFIEQCHRVLKPDGRLIVSTVNIKPFSVVKALREVLGVRPSDAGMIRAGYTEAHLFRILKNGFDVLNVRSYSRFFVELTDVFVQTLLRRRTTGDSARRDMRVYSLAGVFYRLAFQLDLLLFLNKGHHLIATAKRRAWRPRKAPILVDGRSISEAVLSRAAD